MPILFISRFSLVVSAILFSVSSLDAGEPVRVMSFNLRYGKANDGDNHWDKRKSLLADTVRDFDPDVLGTQETLKFQADFLMGQLEGYEYFGRSRMKEPNEHCGILYRKERFTWLAGGHFWLSKTPLVPASKSWDSSLPRMASWVLLGDNKDERGDPVLVINTHFDHRGAKARSKSAELIRERIEQLRHLAKNPLVVVTGDFNTAEASDPYKALLDENDELVDTFRISHPEKSTNEGTFNSWTGKTNGPRIDWILADKRWTVQSAEIDRSSHNKRNPSDHFPVTAVLVRP
jgi:endonuclease/exonuclease/phosphatase family metal-dependent hydrolase